MKVYIVIYEYNRTPEFVAVFSTYEDAQEGAKVHNNMSLDLAGYWIERWQPGASEKEDWMHWTKEDGWPPEDSLGVAPA